MFSELATEANFAGIFALLDFLMGNSIGEVTRRHRFYSTEQAEAAIRAVLLLHGYEVASAKRE